MWDAVSPTWAAISRKTGTGAELDPDDILFSAPGFASFAGGPMGPGDCRADIGMATSTTKTSATKTTIRLAHMQTDCSATRSAPMCRRGAAMTAGRVPALRFRSLRILERISPSLVPGHETSVVFEQIVQMIGIGWE